MNFVNYSYTFKSRPDPVGDSENPEDLDDVEPTASPKLEMCEMLMKVRSVLRFAPKRENDSAKK